MSPPLTLAACAVGEVVYAWRDGWLRCRVAMLPTRHSSAVAVRWALMTSWGDNGGWSDLDVLPGATPARRAT